MIFCKIQRTSRGLHFIGIPNEIVEEMGYKAGERVLWSPVNRDSATITKASALKDYISKLNKDSIRSVRPGSISSTRVSKPINPPGPGSPPFKEKGSNLVVDTPLPCPPPLRKKESSEVSEVVKPSELRVVSYLCRNCDKIYHGANCYTDKGRPKRCVCKSERLRSKDHGDFKKAKESGVVEVDLNEKRRI